MPQPLKPCEKATSGKRAQLSSAPSLRARPLTFFAYSRLASSPVAGYQTPTLVLPARTTLKPTSNGG
jgi:hypothetical protein